MNAERWVRYWARRYASPMLPFEDLCQEGRIALWQGKNVQNAIRQALRRQSRLIYTPSYLSDRGEFPASAYTGETAMRAAEKKQSEDWTEAVVQRLDDAELLAVLTPKQYQVMRAFIFEGQTPGEVATLLGISARAVYLTYQCAIKKMRKMCDATTLSSELTKMEAVVIGLIREGQDAGEMAASMGVSIRAVNSHLANLYTKYDVKSLYKLAFKVWRQEQNHE